MKVDDIIIGSGLSALGVATGLPAGRKILVITGPAKGSFQYYGSTERVPTAFHGRGGLGRYWHGVIPVSLDLGYWGISAQDFSDLFANFYPRTTLDPFLGKPLLFVPYRPIRAPREWRRIERERGADLRMVEGTALGFEPNAAGARVWTADGSYSAQRLWIAAGAVHTPALLASQPAFTAALRNRISDHVILYAGQIDRRVNPQIMPPVVEHSRDGTWFEAYPNAERTAQFTLRPAHFSYRKLDHGTEQRAAFGLPTGSVIAKVARAASLGLIAEALFNKFGLLPVSEILSVYMQLHVSDAYEFDPISGVLAPRSEVIQAAIRTALKTLPWADAVDWTSRTDLFLNAIHLHGSLIADELIRHDINLPGAPIQIVDASAIPDIGPEHHSFKLMANAYALARQS